ncbi:translation initiation factor eIF-2B subunit alpha/beta/delta-like protein [Dimargaris cristalligena]|uniref:Methylthioribose-1-phosphate isomerase n=1 Tax=Dimargaris cristalligena TaxID=215637 RepID=A0A4P9ZZE7_9FUNG|nr:translation initiation factor eIF-2B subunit alpha/beta/delta-like protein [Dimargaris cristalligena]|eukprot:RKP38190.1 translation initiation factor eIF-2B subunit alpha/beta/delta-like protein [Dimargaris cristalligena]
MFSPLQAILFEPPHQLTILDQLLLPFETVHVPIRNLQEGHRAIHTMQVRGAPAIAIVAVLALVVDTYAAHHTFPTVDSFMSYLDKSIRYLQTSRPTAVNLFEATTRLSRELNELAYPSDSSAPTTTTTTTTTTTVGQLKRALLEYGQAMLDRDIQDNKHIGQFGAEYIEARHLDRQAILDGLTATTPIHNPTYTVLTHCNTGALATAGWGTALGIIRSLNFRSIGRIHVYCTETRPYNQGSRLTAYELVHDKIPATLITDSMASALLASRPMDAIVVGADRVTANGDTANKIGTYQLAITAQYHGVPFIVAAPTTSIDLKLATGAAITIEERPKEEMLSIYNMRLAAQGIQAWNPSFDVTPACLIEAIVTELGVITKNDQGVFDIKGFIEKHRSL